MLAGVTSPVGEGELVGGDSGARRLRAFRSLAANTALLRVLGGYTLFILTEYSV